MEGLPQGIPQQELLDAGVHFGHLRKKWNPKMLPYIFMERKGIHIIDLAKTNEGLVRAAAALKQLARSGRRIMFVATKKQAKDIIAEAATRINMPFVTDRWLGGMLTNFSTIRKSIKKMNTIDKALAEGAVGLVKKERLMLEREREKLSKVLGGIANLNRTLSALFVVDISHEHLALAEAHKLNLTTVGIVDTNADPTLVDYAIPANDDASKSISIITNYIIAAIEEGLKEREQDQIDNPNNEEVEAEFSDERFSERGKDDEKDDRRRGGNRRRSGGDNNNSNDRQGGGNRGGGKRPPRG